MDILFLASSKMRDIDPCPRVLFAGKGVPNSYLSWVPRSIKRVFTLEEMPGKEMVNTFQAFS